MTGQTSSRSRLIATAPVPDRAYEKYATLAARGLNFEPMTYDQAERDPDWHVDHGLVALPPETPGPPEPDGSFATASRMLASYAFADPTLVRAVYDPASPLDRRDLLLVGRFFGLRFSLGVRIGGVVDEPSEDGRIHRFGWHYRTLEGHLERGHMDYELRKELATGEVEFRIHAYSQRAHIDNPIVRLGFVLFGRSTQLRFYERSLARMRAIVIHALQERGGDGATTTDRSPHAEDAP